MYLYQSLLPNSVSGVNSGVMLMNLTRMRAFSWTDYVVPIYKEYKLKITWGDQDIINIIFHFHPGNFMHSSSQALQAILDLGYHSFRSLAISCLFLIHSIFKSSHLVVNSIVLFSQETCFVWDWNVNPMPKPNSGTS